FEEKDWRGLSPAGQKKRFSGWLRADRQRGFDLSVPPLMRVAVIRLGERSYRFVWTFHHLLLDARAFTIVLNELFAFYEALKGGYELELNPPRPYREFIDWYQQQDFCVAKSF